MYGCDSETVRMSLRLSGRLRPLATARLPVASMLQKTADGVLASHRSQANY